jgi:aminopeptidase N
MAGGPSLEQNMVQMRAGWLQSFVGKTKTIRDDRFPHPDQALNANTYPKGAWVLHMLRHELGDEAFFGALRHYYETCRGRSVATADFVAAIEQHTEQELDWFFSQWLDRIGCPELRVTADEGGLLVEQLQQGEPYTFWLRIEAGPAGQRSEHRLRITEARQVVPVDGALDDVVLDPKVELLFRTAR